MIRLDPTRIMGKCLSQCNLKRKQITTVKIIIVVRIIIIGERIIMRGIEEGILMMITQITDQLTVDLYKY